MKPFLAALFVFLCLTGGISLYGAVLYDSIMVDSNNADLNWNRVEKVYLLKEKTMGEFLSTAKSIVGKNKNIIKDLIQLHKDLKKKFKALEKQAHGKKLVFREFEKSQRLFSFSLKDFFLKASKDSKLKSNNELSGFKKQALILDNHLKNSRNLYNQSAQEYNKKIFKFPTAFVAMFFGFERKVMFKTYKTN